MARDIDITIAPMHELPVGYKARLRELSLGGYEPWGFWSWTFHDGSTWAAIAFEDRKRTAENIIGWAAVTEQIDMLPVVGCYVEKDRRGSGVAEDLIVLLLRNLIRRKVLESGGSVYASTWRWPKYTEIIESAGLHCLDWV